MTVVVTGVAGHAGANLVRALLAQGRPPRALIHVDQQAVQGLDVEVIKGDICDLESLVDAFEGAEVVYHLAAHISILKDEWPLLESVNVIGTRNVVEACLCCGVRRLIHFSSIYTIMQAPMDIPIDKSRPLVESKHLSPYDRSKVAAEKEVRKGIEKGLDAIIISPTAIIGPHDYRPSHFGEALLRLASGNLPALVNGGFDWVDVRDVIKGAMWAEERAPTGAKYILSGHRVSLRDVAMLVEHTKGYYQQNISCPFLNDDLCSIYEVRPYSCAGLVAFTPTDYCRPDSAATAHALKAFPIEVINDRSFYYGRIEKPVPSFMPIAVYEIIKNGIYYLCRLGIPGLDNLEYEFYADTEVVSTLHKHGLRS